VICNEINIFQYLTALFINISFILDIICIYFSTQNLYEHVCDPYHYYRCYWRTWVTELGGWAWSGSRSRVISAFRQSILICASFSGSSSRTCYTWFIVSSRGFPSSKTGCFTLIIGSHWIFYLKFVWLTVVFKASSLAIPHSFGKNILFILKQIKSICWFVYFYNFWYIQKYNISKFNVCWFIPHIYFIISVC